MLTVQEVCEPEIAGVFDIGVKRELSNLLGFECSTNFDSETKCFTIEFEDRITQAIIDIAKGEIAKVKIRSNNFIYGTNVKVVDRIKVSDGANSETKRPIGRPRQSKEPVKGTKNKKSYRVEDSEAIARCTIYFNRTHPHLWEEKAEVALKTISGGIKKYGMEEINLSYNKDEGYITFTVKGLNGIAIYDVFTRLKNYASSTYARKNKDQTPEVLEQIKMWGLPQKWFVVIEYPNGDKQTAIEYDWSSS